VVQEAVALSYQKKEHIMRRYKMSKGKSRRSFKKGTRVAGVNRRVRPMRGGTRL